MDKVRNISEQVQGVFWTPSILTFFFLACDYKRQSFQMKKATEGSCSWNPEFSTFFEAKVKEKNIFVTAFSNSGHLDKIFRIDFMTIVPSSKKRLKIKYNKENTFFRFDISFLC